MRTQSPSPEMLAGRRALDGLSGVELIEDWTWESAFGRWSLLLRLAIAQGSERVPRSTDWYFVVESGYPLGRIWVNPAKENGLTETFPHQRINLPIEPEAPWLNGNICVTNEIQSLNRYVLNEEPWTAHRRLKWYVRRALTWLETAANNKLFASGDPFEMPEFLHQSDEKSLVAFSEDAERYLAWQESSNQFGFFEYSKPLWIQQGILVQRFLTPQRKPILEIGWSESAQDTSTQRSQGIWLRLPALPVIKPWQAPTTWGELEDACAQNDIDLLPLLERASHRVRNGKSHLGLVGFPVSRTIGAEPVQMHWQAFLFPALSHGHAHPDGFRPTQNNQFRMDRRSALAPLQSIKWLKSANWHPDEISARGRLPEDVRQAKVAIIGAGALGSVVAEMLARAGVSDILIIDDDYVEMGNLVRHTLTTSDLRNSKAEAVTRRLTSVSPNIQVSAYVGAFPPKSEQIYDRLRGCQVIVDTTASDEVIAGLGTISWDDPKIMLSLSLSMGANRIYIFSTCSTNFPVDDFHRHVDPLLLEDAEAWQERGLPWEGTGCWNPVMPARVDDIWLLAAASIKEIEAAIKRPPEEHQFCVFEQVSSEQGFLGIKRHTGATST